MIVSIYKPVGPTSHDIIDKIRQITGEKKVGHAGTLDPLASGVLVVGIGRQSTKRLSRIVKQEKEYLATIKLGEQSTTLDAEGKKQVFKVKNPPSLTRVKEALQKFEGKINQVPPAYSAIKISGMPAYKLARQGKLTENGSLKVRKVEIKNIELVKYNWPFLTIRTTTSPGVYIRALARDLGQELGTGAYLKTLERMRVGGYTKGASLGLKKFAKIWQDKQITANNCLKNL